MEEFLGKYYHQIISSFYNYIEENTLKDEKTIRSIQLIHQIIHFEEEVIESDKIIDNHGELLALKNENNFQINIICLIFEVYLDYSEELEDTINYLKNSEILERDKNYLTFIEKLLEVRYARNNEIIEKFKILLRYMPDDYEIVRMLWTAYYEEICLDTVLKLVELANQKEGFNNSIMHFKGFIFKEMERFEDALNVYTDILNFDLQRNTSKNKIAWNYLFLSDCYSHMDNMEGVINNCNKSLKYLNEVQEDDDLIILLLNLRGEAYIHQNNINLALKDFREVLKINEEDVTALTYLNDYT